MFKEGIMADYFISNGKKENIANRSVSYVLLMSGIGIGGVGYWQEKLFLFVMGIMIVWGASLFVCLHNIKKYFLFFLFQISMFTFLLSQPFIGIFRGEEWRHIVSQSAENVWFGLTIIMISELALFCGVSLGDITDKHLFYDRNDCKEKKELRKNLQVISQLAFFITMVFFVIEQLEPLVVIGRNNYLEYYSGFESQLPGLFHMLASFMQYSLAIFLSTLPDKRKAVIPLGLNIMSKVPMLLIGVRNPFVLSILFSISYYILRDYSGRGKKWIGKLEKSLIGIGIPIGVIFLKFYEYIRSGIELSLKESNPLSLFVDFFYSQGTTFNTLIIGYGYRADLRGTNAINYTFGGFIDYIYRGTLGQRIWGTEPLTSYNSEFNAANSNNMSHALSNYYLGDEYLKGRGRGSCFLLENYIDFGYLGVFLFSLLLGVLLIYMVTWFGKRMLLSTIILISIMNIFFVPRAEATEWLTFIVTIRFWLCVFGCYFAAFLSMKCTFISKIFAAWHLYPNDEA